MEEVAENEDGQSTLARVPFKKVTVEPPDAITAARARQSVGKMSFPPASAMEEVDQRLLYQAHADNEDVVEEFDV